MTVAGLTFASRFRASRAAREERAILRKDLEAFSTHAELLELSAVLDRYPDIETDVVRRQVNWHSAA